MLVHTTLKGHRWLHGKPCYWWYRQRSTVDRFRVDSKWIKTKILNIFCLLFLQICFFLDTSKESLIGLKILLLWWHKDDISIACKDNHPVYQTQHFIAPKYINSRELKRTHLTQRPHHYVQLVTVLHHLHVPPLQQLNLQDLDIPSTITTSFIWKFDYFRPPYIQVE